jgi:hypothetical protein
VKRARCWISALWVVCIGLSLGCNNGKTVSKAEINSLVTQAAQSLPDGNAVLATLEKKDYEGAVTGLSKIHQSVTPGSDQEAQFLTLKQHVKSVLIQLAPTDPKADEALNALRQMTQGR